MLNHWSPDFRRPSVSVYLSVRLSVNFSHVHSSRTTGLVSTKLGSMHLWVKGIQDCSNEVPHPFPRGDKCNEKIMKIEKKSSPEPQGQYQTNFIYITKHSLVKGFQVCSNEGSCPFPRRYNNKILKIHWPSLIIFIFRTIGPISNKLGTKHSRF